MPVVEEEPESLVVLLLVLLLLVLLLLEDVELPDVLDVLVPVEESVLLVEPAAR